MTRAPRCPWQHRSHQVSLGAGAGVEVVGVAVGVVAVGVGDALVAVAVALGVGAAVVLPGLADGLAELLAAVGEVACAEGGAVAMAGTLHDTV